MPSTQDSPEAVASMTDEEYVEYVRDRVRAAEAGAERAVTTDEVLAILEERRRGRARRGGT
jgi:hypothetical protein